jgi:large subunit ribosomal protein L6
MSRVGKKPIIIPENVDVTIDQQHVSVKGPKGELSHDVNPVVDISLSEEDGTKVITLSVKNQEEKNERSQWGTAQSILENLVKGVSEGFEKQLEVNGVGYRVAISGNKLTLNVGYSHPVEFLLPDGLEGKVEDNLITISGADKQLVGEVTARIRKVRKPEPYKGKGIKYIDEIIRRKAGKTAKAE